MARALFASRCTAAIAAATAIHRASKTHRITGQRFKFVMP
jgi:hypothetical protein